MSNDVHIRWMIRRDMPAVLEIESLSFEFPYDEDRMIRLLRQRETIGMVAEVSEQVVGFMIYDLLPNRLHISNFAVHPNHRRCGVGRAMADRLICKLSFQRRDRIVLEVRETNLVAQKFFRSLGFRAIDPFETDEDAYVMRYSVPVMEECK